MNTQPALPSVLLSLTPLASLALVALTPAPASAGCLADGLPATCEYLPYRDDFGPVANTSGVDAGRAATANDPIDDILYRVTIPDTGIYVTQATCNDGSPAVMYVREALDPASADKWVFMLEGGGAAFEPRTGDLAEGMWKRWTGPAKTDWFKKASTDWYDASTNTLGARDGEPDLPSELVVGGILDSSLSSFADWNWVFVNYCSSDQWAGRVSNLELPGAGSWEDGGVVKQGFKANFNGHYIVEAALALLRRNFQWGTDQDPDYAMPDIDDASVVLVVGESGGGGGVRNNLDYIQYALSYYNPDVEVYGSIGATLKPEPGLVGESWYADVIDQAGNPSPNGVDDVIDGARNQDAQMTLINGFRDVSCAFAHLDDWPCGQTATLLPFITTPVFIKQDLGDQQTSAPYSSQAVYAEGIRALFDEFASTGQPFFGPRCNKHETLSNGNYGGHVLELQGWTGSAPDGVVHDTLSYDDALWRFVDSMGAEPFAYHGWVFNDGVDDYVWVSSC